MMISHEFIPVKQQQKYWEEYVIKGFKGNPWLLWMFLMDAE